MTTLQVPHPHRPTPPAQDCCCSKCGNINRQTSPGHPCVWASGEETELALDPGANCSGFVVSMGGVR